MAKGYEQMEGLDFLDTFFPVTKLTTICTKLRMLDIYS